MPPGVWYVGIEATNSGRLGTAVSQFGFQLPNGRHMQNIYDFLGQPVELPMPLAPGGKATMTYAAQHIREILREECISGRTSGPTSRPDMGASRETRTISASGSQTFPEQRAEIRAAVATWPPLLPEQRATLRILLDMEPPEPPTA